MTKPTNGARLSFGRDSLEQRTLLDHLRDRSLIVDGRARAAAEDLTVEQLAQPRRDGGWGAGQLLEHLVVAADDYLGALERRLARDAGEGQVDALWRPSFIGGMLIRSLDETATRRMPAPRRWRVDSVFAAPDSLARFLAAQERLRAAIEGARRHHLQRVRFASPVLPLLRMNAGDALTVVVVHSERHMAQLERVARELRASAAATS